MGNRRRKEAFWIVYTVHSTEAEFMHVRFRRGFLTYVILRVSRLEVSVFNVYITNQFQTTSTQGGEGGVKSVSSGGNASGGKEENSYTFVPMTSKNSASG
jgi:hypothetical protein